MKVVFISSALITLATTPWVNSDALIIPKIILIFVLASYLLPILLTNYKLIFIESKLRILTIISIIFVLIMLAVIFISEAPFEQEFFGRTGRGLGFVTYFSLFIIMIYTALRIKYFDLLKLYQWLFLSCIISSTYSLLQYYGYDIFEWKTQTNGIIGTIGNPNFQSSFVAIAFLPSIVYLWNQKGRVIKVLTTCVLFIFVLYICESTQGYIALFASVLVFSLLYLLHKKSKLYFLILFVFSSTISGIAILGMLNKGPLSYYLYKVSVRSRGEMWDTAFTMIQDNLLFGVGLDSVGDYSLMYQSSKTANGIAEYIDNVHNFFLQFAATGGLLLAIVYFSLVCFVGYSFISKLIVLNKFDMRISALFGAWISFQLQSLISPAAIPTLIWNFIICGTIIGLEKNEGIPVTTKSFLQKNSKQANNLSDFMNLKSVALSTLAFITVIPLFNADKLAREANIKQDPVLSVQAARKYPESVVRYNRLGADLYSAGLYDLSLEIGRNAVEFNPNSYLTWILILVNPNAPIQERQIAKDELVRIAPQNIDIQNYSLE
jgi:O-antigen ligase